MGESVGKVSPFPAAVVKKYERVEAERVTRRGSRPPRSPGVELLRVDDQARRALEHLVDEEDET